jgi:putative addiction module killer protein
VVCRAAGSRGAARITVRIRRLSLGNPGDVRPVGSGVSEMRIDYGPGYRVYFVGRGDMVVILLCGGDKQHQDRDIARALELAQEVQRARRFIERTT